MSQANEPDYEGVHLHMRWLGRGALAHANWHANYISHENPAWGELSVLQAAHAAEILIKARIAEEHPLLIFENLPKSKNPGSKMSIDDLFESGRTVQWKDLPDRLWATTGIELPNRDLFHRFGRTRNAIQHFASKSDEPGNEAADFIYGVVDPFMNSCWGLFAIDHNEDDPPYTYLADSLLAREVEFLVSKECAEELSSHELEFKRDNGYAKEMRDRIAKALVSS